MKESFLILFNKFRIILLQSLDSFSDDEDYKTLWFRCTVGRLRSIGRDYIKYLEDMREVLVEKDTLNVKDGRIAEYFYEIENILYKK